jgi:hypothetical protein
MEELDNPRVGNRFDSLFGNFSVLYFGSSLQVCFGETLARFRPDASVAALVAGSWSEEGFMMPGEVPAAWRHQRLAVRACCADDNATFLDVESVATRTVLSKRLAPILHAYGVSDLDVSAIRGGDRRITRVIAHYAWSSTGETGEPRYAGVRYLSRLNTNWECWAVFDRVPTTELERRSITLEMSELGEIAQLYNLTLF